MTDRALLVSLLCPVAAMLASATVVGQPTAATGQQVQVLALNSSRRDAPASVVADQVFQRVLGGRLGARLDYYGEYSDLARFPGAEHDAGVRDFLRAKYRDQRFDVVLAPGNSALEFAARYRDEIFPGAPIVFATGRGVDVPDNATGIFHELNFSDTVDVILRLHPGVRRIVVVSGASEWDQYYEVVARRQFDQFRGRLAFDHLSGLPMPELLAKVANLPQHSVVYYLTLVEDGEGRRYPALGSLDQLASATNRPIYSWHNAGLEHGIVGGSLMSQESMSLRMAELAMRVLEGERAGDIPVEAFDANAMTFDWRQLRRWDIDEARLPPNSTVLFRQPTISEQYGSYIVAGLALMALQFATIVALLVLRARRRQTERVLQQSKQRYALATAAGATGVWDWSLDTDEMYIDPQLKRLLGFEDHEIRNHLDDWGRRVHPDDAPEVMARARACLENGHAPYEVEHRMLHKDGSTRWFLARGTVIRGDDGVARRFVGTDTDITERKRAQGEIEQSEASLRARNEEIRDLAGRLIAAQEVERTRIARELHDDVSQQLAGLSITLSSLRQRARTSRGGSDLDSGLEVLQQRTIGLADSVRQLSHRLHPGALQHAGLVPALRAHCEEFGKQNDIALSFAADDDFGAVSDDVKVCLFRVAQEALRNTARHAAASHAQVRLTRTAQGAELTVADDGQGFDVAFVSRQGQGLGLRSIHERVRQAGGTVSILAERRRGTTVQVSVPLAAPQPAGDGAPAAARQAGVN